MKMRNILDMIAEASTWSKNGGDLVRSGDTASFTIKEQKGPGIHIYIILMKLNGKVFRLKGQKQSIEDAKKEANSWFRMANDESSSRVFTSDRWVTYKD